MAVNKFLDELYGTTEKLKEASYDDDEELLDDEDITEEDLEAELEDLSDEELEELADYLEEEAEEEDEEDEDDYEDELDEEDIEKTAEWDLAGRWMAHAYVDELDKIAKRGVARGVKKGLRRLYKRLPKKLRKRIRRRRVGLAAALGLGAGVPIGAAVGRKRKAASALDTLAEQRVLEILEGEEPTIYDNPKIESAVDLRAAEIIEDLEDLGYI